MHQDLLRKLGKEYKAGEIIYRQKDFADRFFVIQEGRIEITRETSNGQSLLVNAGDGEVFGIVSLFTDKQTRFSTARAVTNARILSVDAKVLIERLHQDPSIAFRIIRHLSQRIFDLDHRIPKMNSRHILNSVVVADHIQERKLLNVHDFNVEHHFLIVEDEIEFFSLINGWLLDSDEEISKLVQLQLPSHKLTHATTFKHAERLLGQEKYDLILLDLNLPDSHGYDETFVRINEKSFDTPIIIFTGMDDYKKSMMAIASGAQDYLIKGQVNKKTFLRSICHALSRHKLIQQYVSEISIQTEKNHDTYLFTLFDWAVYTKHNTHGH
ncbi:MAG: cyclic nucleotide-binding domain-containing protein [Magnetococcus sp. YQC-5]